MEKIKDFFYNKNDILVALLILVIAAAVIVFRIDAIMEYPKTLVDQQNQTVEENIAPTDANDNHANNANEK